MKTYILDIQRLSTEDGPGIRTTVFFKGCNLACKWCHNPESISFERQKYWVSDKCIACRTCVEICPEKAVTFDENGLIIKEELCTFCLACREYCPGQAIEVKGEEMPVSTLAHELLKDKAFYDTSGGGVTLSGGEAALQTEYALDLLKCLKAANIHTALDTAGCYPYHILQTLLPYLNLVLLDIKVFDESRHKELTGVSNASILQNAQSLAKEQNVEIWVRTPIIPDCTDDDENIGQIGKFIAEHMPNISRWELLSFNNLSREKYRLLGKDWEFKTAALLERSKMESLIKTAKKYFPAASWTGAVKLEEKK
jgi:pyruvate formate lyase activating enzyme